MHPSQSWDLEEAAEPFAKALQDELKDLDFVVDVAVALYHMDRIVLSVDLTRHPGTAELRRIPPYFHGFEVKVGKVGEERPAGSC